MPRGVYVRTEKNKNGQTSDGAKKAWKTRIKNGTNHKTATKEGHAKGVETKKRLGIDKIVGRKAIETRRKNGTDKGYHLAEETKEKLRIYRLNQVKEHGCYTQVGKNEKKLLDIFEQKFNVKIIRQHHIPRTKFTVDGYCPEINAVIEIYEQKHYSSLERITKDEKRLEKICLYMDCYAIVINNEKDIDKIQQIIQPNFKKSNEMPKMIGGLKEAKETFDKFNNYFNNNDDIIKINSYWYDMFLVIKYQLYFKDKEYSKIDLNLFQSEIYKKYFERKINGQTKI